ncbi:30S ribosomal protein S8 [bacterium]|nr:MAG: 30S ribosomal protein S8 [bacterium]
MHTDPIADMLTRIRNAQAVKKFEVIIPSSGIKVLISKALKENGYISKVQEYAEKEKKFIKLTLRYIDGKSKIKEIKRVSKPGNRVYVKSKNLHNYLNGFGVYIVSTSQGVMTDREARKGNLGGEIICSIG